MSSGELMPDEEYAFIKTVMEDILTNSEVTDEATAWSYGLRCWQLNYKKVPSEVKIKGKITVTGLKLEPGQLDPPKEEQNFVSNVIEECTKLTNMSIANLYEFANICYRLGYRKEGTVMKKTIEISDRVFDTALFKEARKELELVEKDTDLTMTSNAILDAIAVLIENGVTTNEYSAKIAVNTIKKLVYGYPLLPVHSFEENPEEWADVSSYMLSKEDIVNGKRYYQNMRYSKLFRRADGTYSDTGRFIALCGNKYFHIHDDDIEKELEKYGMIKKIVFPYMPGEETVIRVVPVNCLGEECNPRYGIYIHDDNIVSYKKVIWVPSEYIQE